LIKLTDRIKKSIITNYFLGALCIIYPSTALAVDGYKNLKFGDSIKTVVNSGICTFEQVPSPTKGITYYTCEDFKFGNAHTQAWAFFIDEKFLRMSFDIPVDSAVATIEAMANKYGAPSSRSTPSEFKAIDTTPNQTAFYAFEQDTAYIFMESQADNSQIAYLMYTSPTYNALLIKKQKNELDGDIEHQIFIILIEL
jgi:hypothetical protein